MLSPVQGLERYSLHVHGFKWSAKIGLMAATHRHSDSPLRSAKMPASQRGPRSNPPLCGLVVDDFGSSCRNSSNAGRTCLGWGSLCIVEDLHPPKLAIAASMRPKVESSRITSRGSSYSTTNACSSPPTSWPIQRPTLLPCVLDNAWRRCLALRVFRYLQHVRESVSTAQKAAQFCVCWHASIGSMTLTLHRTVSRCWVDRSTIQNKPEAQCAGPRCSTV